MNKLLLGSVLLAVSATAELYRWVDDDGRVQFSDRPPPSQNAEPVTLRQGNHYQPRKIDSTLLVPTKRQSTSRSKKRSKSKTKVVAWSDNQCRTAKLRARKMALKKSQGDMQTVLERREKLRQLRQKIRQRC